MPKAEIDGWVDIGNTPHRTLPTLCPKCTCRLHKVDVSHYLGVIYLFCPSSRCRYCVVYDA